MAPAEFEGSWALFVLRLAARTLATLALTTILLVAILSLPYFKIIPKAEMQDWICAVTTNDSGCKQTTAALKEVPEEKRKVLVPLKDKRWEEVFRNSGFSESADLNLADASVNVENFGEDGFGYQVVLKTKGVEPLSLMSVRGLWTTSPLFAAYSYFEREADWPFYEVKFPATPYAGIELFLSRADLSGVSQDQLLALKTKLEGTFGYLPSAKSNSLKWQRRLTGPIQFACYFMFCWGVTLILLHYAVNISTNAIVRSMATFTSADVKSATGETNSIAESNEDVSEEGAATGGSLNPQQNAQRGSLSEAKRIYSPWQSTVRGTLDDFISSIEAIDDIVRKRTGFLGAYPALPVVEIKQAGLYAMKTSKTGENIPSFVSAEVDATAERLESHHRMITFIVWAIPTLGFLGTVLGLGDSLLSTIDTQSSQAWVKSVAEGVISVEIGVAFDTTLVALVLSFALMFLYHLVQRGEDQMLAREKREAIDDLLTLRNLREEVSKEDIASELSSLTLAMQKTQDLRLVVESFQKSIEEMRLTLAGYHQTRSSRRHWYWLLFASVVSGLLSLYYFWSIDLLP